MKYLLMSLFVIMAMPVFASAQTINSNQVNYNLSPGEQRQDNWLQGPGTFYGRWSNTTGSSSVTVTSTFDGWANTNQCNVSGSANCSTTSHKSNDRNNFNVRVTNTGTGNISGILGSYPA